MLQLTRYVEMLQQKSQEANRAEKIQRLKQEANIWLLEKS